MNDIKFYRRVLRLEISEELREETEQRLQNTIDENAKRSDCCDEIIMDFPSTGVQMCCGCKGDTRG